MMIIICRMRIDLQFYHFCVAICRLELPGHLFCPAGCPYFSYHPHVCCHHHASLQHASYNLWKGVWLLVLMFNWIMPKYTVFEKSDNEGIKSTLWILFVFSSFRQLPITRMATQDSCQLFLSSCCLLVPLHVYLLQCR